jgi:hypothetical protein
MVDVVPSPLIAWENFYVIVGSSGAALTGLQFVVMALVAEMPRRSTHDEISAFGTPTVVHFSTVLLVSAMMSVPWISLRPLGVLFGFAGGAGVGYLALVLRRARKQTGYKPVWEDWLWHTILPLVAYLGFAIAGVTLNDYPATALLTVGAMSVLLLFVGIHNSWDTVTYIAVERTRKPAAAPAEERTSRLDTD